MHVVVLKGGLSAEREVSLTSGAAVEKAVRELGYACTSIDVNVTVAADLVAAKPDVVFNALHGRYGEDGTVQGLLELLKIPYTHSGVLASALAMDKPIAKKIFAQAGLRCAEGGVFSRADVQARHVLKPPYVIKPLNEGSSVGVMIVTDESPLKIAADSWLAAEGGAVLVERYIPGREIQVAVLDDHALGAIEIKPLNAFYDYEAKYTDGKATHLMPAPLSASHYDEVLGLALAAHRALGCRGLTRSDFRFDEEGDGLFYILETNTQPGMTPLSLSPEIAAHVGISFNDLVDRLIKGARLDG